MTNATYTQPASVDTYVKSATHNLFGANGQKLRFTRSCALVAGAAGFPASQGGGQLVQLAADFGQGGVGEGLNPPGESGDSKLIETMLPHRYSDRYRRYAPISQAAYLRSIHTGAGC